MQRFIIATILWLAAATAGLGAKTPIQGESSYEAEHLCAFVQQYNEDFPLEIAVAFVEVGRRYGIRADIALCQAIVETGWFKFTGGTAVTIQQNNFCGLGVTRLGLRGAEFSTVEEGVTAQMQHLFAYSCRNKLPKGERLLDPRFKLVRRGSARHWEDLSGLWAANKNYGRDIMAVYGKLKKFKPKKQALARVRKSKSEPTVGPTFTAADIISEVQRSLNAHDHLDE